MSTPDPDSKQRALSREWLAALVTIGGTLVIAIAVAAYLTFRATPETAAPDATAATQQPGQELTADQVAARQAEAAKLGLQYCSAGLADAQNFGIVPAYGKLIGNIKETDTKGRYVCVATTNVTKYTIAIDLMCRDPKDPRCVSLYTVSQDDGSVLYQRQG